MCALKGGGKKKRGTEPASPAPTLALASTAKEAANADTMAFVLAYVIAKGPGMYADADDVNTIAPRSLFSIILDRKWCVIWTAATALHSRWARILSRGTVWKKPVRMKPALLNTRPTSMSAVALASCGTQAHGHMT